MSERSLCVYIMTSIVEYAFLHDDRLLSHYGYAEVLSCEKFYCGMHSFLYLNGFSWVDAVSLLRSFSLDDLLQNGTFKSEFGVGNRRFGWNAWTGLQYLSQASLLVMTWYYIGKTVLYRRLRYLTSFGFVQHGVHLHLLSWIWTLLCDWDIWFPSCTFIAGDSALHGGDFIETLRIDFAGDCVM